MNHNRISSAIGVGFIVAWSGFVVAAYFVVQKPLALQVINHLFSLAWTFAVTSILLLNALALGTFTLRRLIPDIFEDASFPFLACGIGLGELGLLGFGLAALGASNFPILLTIQIILLAWMIWQGLAREVILQIKHSTKRFKDSGLQIPVWMKAAGFIAFALTFLLTLLPPMEAFDALLYHLTVPDLWLRDAGLRPYNFPHYWFPGLVEGVYLWGLGLSSEIVPQQLHFLWAVSTALLLWNWTRHLWDDRTAWWTLMFMVSMPSLLLLASWAYTDLALSFFGVSMLYTLWRGRVSNDPRWWKISAIAAGMAMGVKYTSFVMPLTAVALIAIWKFRDKKAGLLELLRFSSISAITGGIWYLRNWIWMDNPFYPFVFEGRYWDSFRAAWFAGAGTGSGWDLKALISLPLTITLGYQDMNVFDGNIGPLLLLCLPALLLALAGFGKLEQKQRTALGVILLFTAASAAFWAYGYMATRNLWQTRLLLPALVPFTLPAAFGMANIRSLDTKRIRVSFVASSIAALAIFTNLLDMGLSVIARAPFAVATGVVSREEYAGRFQPAFTSALAMIDRMPQDSRVYFLFEPRSYGSSRYVQPDPILDNFSHDVFLYGTPEAIINNWRARGYTHILVNKRGAMLVLVDKDEKAIFDKTTRLLISTSTSQDGSYEIFEIPLP
jgi:hypothetical protein